MKRAGCRRPFGDHCLKLWVLRHVVVVVDPAVMVIGFISDDLANVRSTVQDSAIPLIFIQLVLASMQIRQILIDVL